MLNKEFIERIKLPFRKEKELYLSLHEILGFYPRHIEYYKTALLHSSVAMRSEKGRPINNERLEYLGDAVLSAVSSHIVYHHFPGKREGFLTTTRAKLVQRETLGQLARELGIDRMMVTNTQHNKSHNSYMGGNAFEALVGAIYLDQGYDACMKFMRKRILKHMINIDKMAYKEVNFKSKLLEWTQKNRVRMEFRMLKQDKDDKGSPIFGFVVVIEGVEGEKGQGYSKKEAQQIASKETLQRLRREPQFIDAIFQAKSERTKMEEEPTMAAPNLEAEKTDFIIESKSNETNRANKPNEPNKTNEAHETHEANTLNEANKTNKANKARKPQEANQPQPSSEDDEFDLSDITHNVADPSREDIIAAAEAAAYEEK